MRTWQKRPANRWAAAAVVIGSVSAVMASPLALDTAAAATPVTGVSITSTTNGPAGGTATVTGTYTPAQNPAPTSIEYTVLGGPDQSTPNNHGTPCTADTSGGFVCHVANGGTPGTDSVRVFGDTNGNNTWDSGEPLADTTVVFSGTPTHVTLTAPGTSGTTGTCSQWTAHATDTNSNPAAGQTLTLTVTENTSTNPASNPPPITLYSADCSTVVDSGGVVSGTGPYTVTYTHTLTVGSDGTVGFGLSANTPGTATVKVSSSPTVSDQANFTWTAGGQNAVTTLTATPSSTTQYTGTQASFTVRATDASGNPVQGVNVHESSTAPDAITNNVCGATNNNGNVTCTITNGGTAGTDHLTFWVNNCTTTCTSGPDTGEPQTTATAVFNQAPAVNSGHSSLTCVQQLAGANQGTAQTDCTVPTSQHAVTFTALVEDASGNPIPGATVTFTATSATLGGTTPSPLPSGTGTTDANGKATFTVNNASPANNDSVTVHATVGSTSVGTATAHWQTPHATGLTVTPALQSVTKGGTVTVKATVTDQFGTATNSGSPTITYTVTGRNNGKTGTAAPDGTITYTDAGTVPSATSDTIHVTEAPDGFTGSAVVDYITGSATPSTVTVDTSGHGTDDAHCAASGNTPATGVAFNHATTVCAIVKNATGEVLAGQPVTFTVSNGQVDKVGGLSSSSTKTFQTTTDAAGVAFADVTSTTSGVQTVTATAGSASGSSTVTYASPAPATAYSIAISPTNPTINPGSSQKFTATVTDKFGNAVPGVSVSFTQSGPGSIGGASSATVTTGTDGTASVTVGTAATDSGSGSVTASISSGSTDCNTAPAGTPPSKCSATATYTVAPTVTPSRLSLSAQSGVRAGHVEHLTATATNSNGTPAAGRVVRFFVGGTLGGANTAQGSATTDASGHASFSYVATHAGTDNLAAYVDTNNDSVREANEPRAFGTAHIASAQRAEHPTISLGTTAVSRTRGTVTVFVATHPKARHALVRYYVRRHGAWHLIGANRTGSAGHAAKTFRERAGRHLRFRVKVSATSTTTRGTSPSRAITVA